MSGSSIREAPMNVQRRRKERMVVELREMFEGAKILVLTHYEGSSVADLTDLRARLAVNGGYFRVTKNRLALRALEGTAAEVLRGHFSGPTAVAATKDVDRLARIPKVLVDFGKDHERFRVIAGVMEGQLLSEAEVKRLADLPTMDELRARLIGQITMPAMRIALYLNQPGTKLARVLDVRAKQV